MTRAPSTVKIGVLGDLLIARRFDTRHSSLRDALRDCDITFGNLECVLHDFEYPPARPSGGTWTRGDPKLAHDLRALGVSVVSLANNHAGDYGADAARTTLRHLTAAGIVATGWGENLQAAAAPAAVAIPGGQIAAIAVASTFPEHSMASAARGRVRARPGINPLRIDYVFQMPKEDLRSAQRVLDPIGVTRETAEGDVVLFGRYRIGSSAERGYRASARRSDLKRLIKGIRAISDTRLILVSHHVHPGRGSLEEEPDEAQEEIAKAAIDAGASIVAGHGAHTLRPVEFYRHGVIMYGLGSAFLEPFAMRPLPWDALDEAQSTVPGKQDGQQRYAYSCHDSSRWGLLARVDVAGRLVRKVEARILVLDAGRPQVVPPRKARQIIDHLRRLSAPRGTALRTTATGLRLIAARNGDR